MENLWKMGIKSAQKLGKLLNKHGFPFSWECVRILWRSWPHIVKLNEWTSVTAIVNFCPMTCRLCYMSTDALNGCGMGPLLVLVSPCFRENVVVTCKIGSFLCNLDNLLQQNVIVFFFFFLKIKFQNDAHLKKGLFLTYFSHFLVTRENLSYQNSFSRYLTHIHTCILLTLLSFLPYQFWKKYEFIRYGFSLVWFLVLILIHAIFRTINK